MKVAVDMSYDGNGIDVLAPEIRRQPQPELWQPGPVLLEHPGEQRPSLLVPLFHLCLLVHVSHEVRERRLLLVPRLEVRPHLPWLVDDASCAQQACQMVRF